MAAMAVPALKERYYSLAEFSKALGVTRKTYQKYRAMGALPEPPKQGGRAVFSEAYLALCRKVWKEYRSLNPVKTGPKPRKTA